MWWTSYRNLQRIHCVLHNSLPRESNCWTLQVGCMCHGLGACGNENICPVTAGTAVLGSGSKEGGHKHFYRKWPETSLKVCNSCAFSGLRHPEAKGLPCPILNLHGHTWEMLLRLSVGWGPFWVCSALYCSAEYVTHHLLTPGTRGRE